MSSGREVNDLVAKTEDSMKAGFPKPLCPFQLLHPGHDLSLWRPDHLIQPARITVSSVASYYYFSLKTIWIRKIYYWSILFYINNELIIETRKGLNWCSLCFLLVGWIFGESRPARYFCHQQVWTRNWGSKLVLLCSFNLSNTQWCSICQILIDVIFYWYWYFSKFPYRYQHFQECPNNRADF